MTLDDELRAFLEARAWGLLDGALFAFLLFLASLALAHLNRATLFARLSLRLRISSAIILMAVIMGTAVWLGVPSSWAFLGLLGSVLLIVHFSLRDLARIGILNAYSATSKGVSAERSLALVRKDVSFLGIGAHKLTSSSEFKNALERCKKHGGVARFLLSDPENRGLEKLASQNQKSDASYKSRVRESIREILYQAAQVGVVCEVKIYDIENERSLSRFRMMFIDDRICILSHVIWNKSEGLDNTQIVIRSQDSNPETSMFQSYKAFFDDLWSAPSTRTVTSEIVKKWPH